MYVTLRLFILLGHCIVCWSACTYPSALIGEWYSTSFGTLNFETNQSFTGFTSSLSAAPLSFTCFESSGSQYVSMTSYTVVSNIVADVYLCMNLQQLSTIKYYFTLNGNLDAGTGLRFYTPANSGDTVTLSQACSRSDSRSSGEYELLIKKDQISSAVTSCPGGLRSTFNVTMTTSTVTDCQATEMVGSTGALVFNYSSCVTGQFNSGGYLQCLYSKTDGYGYATLYNNDTTTDEATTYRFTCLTFLKDADILKATESPGICHLAQTPTSVNSPGVTYVMTDLLYVTEEKDYTTIIIVVCSIAGVLIIAVVVLVLYFKVCRKPKPPPKIRKKKRKLSITDYTPRSLGRGLSIEKLDEGEINKKSTEEILSGLTVDKKDKHVLLNGDAYEPPKKKAWQKKWEHDGNKSSPRLTADALKRMKQSFSSDEGISRLEELSVFELDKAYTLSTSLPESLDIPIKQSPRGSNETVNIPKDALGNSGSPRYTEKSHASPHIPASTGKYGGSPKVRSIESINMPRVETKLDTITENPFSRENTAVSLKSIKAKKLKDQQNFTRNLSGGEVTCLSTVLTSHSTASGWQFKWENLMRPKKILPHHIPRSQSPVKLFQNIELEKPWCKSIVSKTDDDKNTLNTNHVIQSEDESKNEEKTEKNEAHEKVNEELGPGNGLQTENKNTNQDEILVEIVSKSDSFIDNSKHLTPINKSGDTHEEKPSGKRNTGFINKNEAELESTLHEQMNNSLGKEPEADNDNNEHFRLDKEKRDNDENYVTDVAATGESSVDLTATDYESTRTDSIRTLEETRFDSVCLHSELFYPEEWLYDICPSFDKVWKIGAKVTSSKRKREYKQYIGADEDMVQKKQISPFKKSKKEE